MIKLRPTTLILVSVFIFTSSFAFATVDDTVTKGRELINTKQYETAYQLLQPFEDERSGDPDFDYILGVSAINSGHVTRGVFALERVLALQPDNASARSYIARAYFELGEKETAKIEFNNLLGEHPPENVTNVINQYLTAIDKSLGLTTTYAAYLEGTIGYDSNVNSATSSSTLGGFMGGAPVQLTLLPGSKKASASFGSISGGASFSSPYVNNLALFGSVNGSQRLNVDEHSFNTGNIDLSLGLKYKKNINSYTIALQDSNYYLDADHFRHAYGISTQWQRDLNQTNQISAFAQFSKLDYVDNSIRNANRYVVGAGWAHVFEGDKTPVIFVSPYLGKEAAESSSADFLSNDIFGIRLGGQLTLKPKLVAFATSVYEYRDYDGTTPFFLQQRQDNQYELSAGFRYLPKPNWIVRPQISYLNNDSNISINQFERTVISVSVRHDFDW